MQSDSNINKNRAISNKERLRVNKKLIAILAIAFAFRLILMKWRYAIGFDEPHYLQLGVAAARSGWQNLFHPYWPPMFPAFIALLSLFSHNFELMGRLVSVITGTAVIIPVYILAKELYYKRIALLAAIIVALFPAIAFSSTNVLAESTYTLLSVSGITVGWFALKQRSLWKGALTGVLFGMTYLTKPEGLGYLIIFIVLATIWQFYYWRRQRRLVLMKIILSTTVMTVLMALPYIVYLKQVTHEWTISGKYKVNRFDLNAINRLTNDNRESPLDMAYHLGTFHEYDVSTFAGNDGHAHTFFILFKRIAENIYKVLRFAISGAISGPMFFLMALGLLAVPWTWSQTKLNIYLLSFLVFFWLMVIPFFHINDRYFAPLVPLCFVWIAQGIVILSQRLGHLFHLVPIKMFAHSSTMWSIMTTIAILIVLSFLPEIGKVIGRNRLAREFWAEAVELKEAGLWLKEKAKPAPVLMSYNKAVDFYAGQFDIRKTATFTQDPIERIIKYAHYRRVNYLVIDERYQEQFPNLSGLFDGQYVPPELTQVYDYISDSGLRVVIYKLN